MLEEFQQKLLQVQSGKNTVHEELLLKFERQRREIDERHKDNLTSMEIKLNTKEADLYKMEQLLLRLNHQVDQSKDEREQANIELDIFKIEKIRLEEQTNYLKEQMQQLKEQNMKQAEEFERKLKEKQMLVWKTEMSQSQLVDQITRLSSEVERLKKIEGLNESIARLPNVCLQDISSEKEAERAKSSALHQALDKVRGKEFDDVVKEIDDLQDKSKNAYIRLYEKVGEDIGLHFLDKLDYLGSKETEADKMISGKYSTAQMELKRLQEEKTRIAKMQRDKEKEYLRPEQSGGKSTNISDLFRKYNV